MKVPRHASATLALAHPLNTSEAPASHATAEVPSLSHQLGRFLVGGCFIVALRGHDPKGH